MIRTFDKTGFSTILGNFEGMDWGDDERNMQHHGSTTPPTYNLRNVNTKVKLVYK